MCSSSSSSTLPHTLLPHPKSPLFNGCYLQAASCSAKKPDDAPQVFSLTPCNQMSVFFFYSQNISKVYHLLSNSTSITIGHHHFPSELLLQPPNWFLLLIISLHCCQSHLFLKHSLITQVFCLKSSKFSL